MEPTKTRPLTALELAEINRQAGIRKAAQARTADFHTTADLSDRFWNLLQRAGAEVAEMIDPARELDPKRYADDGRPKSIAFWIALAIGIGAGTTIALALGIPA